MSKTECSPNNVSSAAAEEPRPLPFLLTSQQGEAARTLLRYVASLDLSSPDAQLLAVVVAIRAARGGVGNIAGMDLAALRLSDARGAVYALRGLGWQLDDALFDGDPATPIPVTVPDLTREEDHPLPFGKHVRSRVSGWTTRTTSAKAVKKLPPVTRLAMLFLAAHSTSAHLTQIPPYLPEACRGALPELLSKGILTELTEEHYHLDPALRHLTCTRHATPQEQEQATQPRNHARATGSPTRQFQFSAEAWMRWKSAATPALRRHAEAVENCAVCSLQEERVAQAFMAPVRSNFVTQTVRAAYGEWKNTHADRGPLAAEFTVAFRAEHGHGPSYTQLCSGLDWDVKRSLRAFIVRRLLTNGWLIDTAPVPWTLRPGPAARAEGISLPRARASATSAGAGR
ncbi:hypothetical protein ACIQJT_35015 [Streptomyces sp. NPDC091972]|uniref:hypothetical protein n=1 Tax=Streptomyces sp. NPDC091972 TaxID=3366007 RepID=UPI0038118A81